MVPGRQLLNLANGGPFCELDLSYKFKIMKKTILMLIAGSFMVGCANLLHAQTMAQGQGGIRITGTDVSYTSTGTGDADAGAAKSARTFWRMYGEAKNEKWYSLPGGSMAQFEAQRIGYRVIFGKKGNWVYTLKQYTEQELPVRVRALVKSVYYDYPITWVKEVNQSQYVVYLIHIENDQEWKTIRVAEDEMEVAEEFSKNPAQ
jgi:hypothetical protein